MTCQPVHFSAEPGFDFTERDTRNRQLAKLGEEFVILLERQRFRTLGWDDLKMTQALR